MGTTDTVILIPDLKGSMHPDIAGTPPAGRNLPHCQSMAEPRTPFLTQATMGSTVTTAGIKQHVIRVSISKLVSSYI